MKPTIALCLCLIPSMACAQRTGQPPSSITVKVSGLGGSAGSAAHNGTFKLVPPSGPIKNVGTATWEYLYLDNPNNPVICWGATINSNGEILVGAGPDRSMIGIWKTTGDVYLVNSVPPTINGPTIQFKALP